MNVRLRFLGEQRFDVFFEEGLSLRARNRWSSWQACLESRSSFSASSKVGHSVRKTNSRSAVVGAHAVEELVGVGEGGEGAPVGV